MKHLLAYLVARSAPNAIDFKRDLPPNLQYRFESGAFKQFLERANRNPMTPGAEVASVQAWVNGYKKNWRVLEAVADPYLSNANGVFFTEFIYHGEAPDNLTKLLSYAAKRAKLTPAGVATGVGKAYEQALVKVITAAENVGAAETATGPRTFIPNWKYRVTAKELHAAVPLIPSGMELGFINSIPLCNATTRPRHVALMLRAPALASTSEMVTFLDICNEDVTLAAAYLDVGVTNLGFLQKCVDMGVPPEYASNL